MMNVVVIITNDYFVHTVRYGNTTEGRRRKTGGNVEEKNGW
jgi:hypothetical protein